MAATRYKITLVNVYHYLYSQAANKFPHQITAQKHQSKWSVCGWSQQEISKWDFQQNTWNLELG